MSTLTMPSETAIDRAANALRETATPSQINLINKAQVQLHKGVEVTVCADGALLIPSGTTAGTIYHLDSLGRCSCPATTPTCRHFWLRAIVEQAQAMPQETAHTRFRDFDATKIVQLVLAKRAPRQPSNWERFTTEDARQRAKSNMRAEMLEIKARPKLGYEDAVAKMNELYG